MTTIVTKPTALFRIYITVDTLLRALHERLQCISTKPWETYAVIIFFRVEQVQG